MPRMNSPEHSATEDLKSKAAEVGENLREMGSQVGDVAREKYEHVRDRAAEMVEAGRKRARKLEEGLEGYVQDKPLKSLLIAAGVGLLIGLWWRRR